MNPEKRTVDIASQGGKTCCRREERCDIPPCSDGGVRKR